MSTVVSESVITFAPTVEPLPRDLSSPPRFSHLPCVTRMQQELGHSLLEISRRARRMGPVDAGAVVLLTGCRPGIGCSTTTLALASMAAVERPVLLIDADMAAAQLTAMIDANGEKEPHAALRRLDPRGLLAFLSPVRTNADAFYEEIRAAVDDMRSHFDILFLDGGAVFTGGSSLARLADVALLVCDAAQTRESVWAQAWDCLEEKGTHVLGIIETMINP